MKILNKMKPLSLWTILGGMVVLGVVAGSISSMLTLDMALEGDWSALFGIHLLIGAIGGLIGGLAGLIWWKRADEGVREAHKWAWYWGGCRGMGLSMVIVFAVIFMKPQWLLAIQEMPVHAAPEIMSPIAIGALGGMSFMMLCALTGYLIAWGVWWWRHS